MSKISAAPSEDEALRIIKKLNEIAKDDSSIPETPEDSIVDMLSTLQTFQMTLDVLQRTRIGLTVNNLRKVLASNDEVVNLSKRLIKRWKKLVESEDTKPGNASLKSNGSKSVSRSNSSSNLERMNGANEPVSMTKTPSSQSANASTTSEPAQKSLFHEYRMKSREMLLASLQGPEMPDGTLDPEDLSARIEDAIFNIYKATSEKYRACIRSRVFNLRDKRNPDLRINVLTGAIPVKILATMSTEEMASVAMRKLRDDFTKQAIDEHQIAVQAGTPTELFKCGKCGSKICTYTQAQTRSADEPMTTFVWCQKCGNRWKFC